MIRSFWYGPFNDLQDIQILNTTLWQIKFDELYAAMTLVKEMTVIIWKSQDH